MPEKNLIVVYDSTDDKNHSLDVEKMTPKEATRFHNRNYRVTIVALLRPDGIINAGVTICSGKDHFDRKKGLRIAKARLIHKPIIIGSILTNKRPLTLKEEKDRKILATKEVQKYAHRIRAQAAKKRHGKLRSVIFKET